MSAQLELAERVLALADGDAQVTVTRRRTLTLPLAAATADGTTEDGDVVAVQVTAVEGGRAGTATTTTTDDEALLAAARRARALAAAGSAHPGLAEPEPYRTHQGFDLATARLDASATGEQLRAAAEAAPAASGSWSARETRSAIASSAGIRASDAVTEVHARVLVPGGFAARSAVAARDIDLPALVREAEARAARDEAAELEPGTYPVVLGEYAVGDLLGVLASSAFNGLHHTQGHGALAGRLGSRVAAATINLSDSPRFAGTLPRAFDADGVPKAPVPLIQDGVAHRVVHDRRSAALAGGAARSTGHALRPGGAPDGPAAANLVLIGGGAEGLDELAGPIARGLYVHRLAALHVLDARTTLVTALTGEGTSLVEDGRLTGRPVQVRFEASVLDLLAGVQALGARPRLVSSGGYRQQAFAPGVVCPPVRVAALRIARPGPYPPGA